MHSGISSGGLFKLDFMPTIAHQKNNFADVVLKETGSIFANGNDGLW
jgi:hypothetical protein